MEVLGCRGASAWGEGASWRSGPRAALIASDRVWLGASAATAPAAGAASGYVRQDHRGRVLGLFRLRTQAGERLRAARSGIRGKLSVYLAPTSTSGQQVLKGVIYSDRAGKPQGLLGVSEQLTFKSTTAAGW